MPTEFHNKLISTARDQYDRFHTIRENQEPLSSQIKLYWSAIGFHFPGVATAWSAVFVSYCVKAAGATAGQFQFAEAHSEGFVALRRWVRICIRSPVTNKMPKTKDAPRKTLPAGIGKVLKRLHHPLDVIVLCVRWYGRTR